MLTTLKKIFFNWHSSPKFLSILKEEDGMGSPKEHDYKPR